MLPFGKRWGKPGIFSRMRWDSGRQLSPKWVSVVAPLRNKREHDVWVVEGWVWLRHGLRDL
eukprot:3579615-Pyramimonas_sp.AAC.1